MANLLQSSQTQATQAPSFYTDYLSKVAGQAQTMMPGGANAPQFVGAQPLQTQAFEAACTSKGTYQPFVQAGQGYLGQAAGTDITGAAQPYLQAGTTASPLCAAKPLICQSANLNLAGLAGQYMSPYVQCAVQRMSDIAMRNMRQNLTPMATAAAVGSGQFGSQRGAQVLGQTEANAMQDLNAQIANMLNTGYGQALQAATQKQSALGQLAQTTSAAQQAQNQAQLQAAQTAGSTAAQEAQALQQAGLGMGTLGQTGQNINLACINALATLGGQQQAIAQNRQNFPLATLSNLASILQGYSIPTATKTTLCMSPVSAAAAIGAGTLGVLTPTTPGGKSPLCLAIGTVKGLFGSNPAGSTTGTSGTSTSSSGGQESVFDPTYGGAFPMDYQVDTNTTGCCYSGDTAFAAHGGLIAAKTGGSIGCKSTRSRGGLPS